MTAAHGNGSGACAMWCGMTYIASGAGAVAVALTVSMSRPALSSTSTLASLAQLGHVALKDGLLGRHEDLAVGPRSRPPELRRYKGSILPM